MGSAELRLCPALSNTLAMRLSCIVAEFSMMSIMDGTGAMGGVMQRIQLMSYNALSCTWLLLRWQVPM